MRKYQFTQRLNTEKTFEVEAESLETAVEIANAIAKEYSDSDTYTTMIFIADLDDVSKFHYLFYPCPDPKFYEKSEPPTVAMYKKSLELGG